MRKYILCLFVCIAFFQCKTDEFGALKKDIKKSYNTKFNGDFFNRSRKLMYNNLSPTITQNDSIILLEYFESSLGNYAYTIYESNKSESKTYAIQTSIKSGKVNIDSLVIIDVPDKILEMVRMDDLDEIKRRGEATSKTPSSTLIINIAIKNKEKGKFDITTLITNDFFIYDN